MNYCYKIVVPSTHLFLFVFYNKADVLTIFLSADVQYDKEGAGFYLDLLNQVITYKKKFKNIRGNVCDLDLDENYSHIKDIFEEAESCVVETPLLRDLLLAWMDEIERFNAIESSCESKRLDPNYTIYCLMASIFSAKNGIDIYLEQLTSDQKKELRSTIQKFINSDEPESVKEMYLQKCAGATHQENSLLSWLITFFNKSRLKK